MSRISVMPQDNIPASIFMQERIFLWELENPPGLRYAARMSDGTHPALARNISSLRRHKKLTQVEFAKMARTQQANISKWENGRTPPEGVSLALIVEMANARVDDFLNKPWSPDETASESLSQVNELELKQAILDALPLPEKPPIGQAEYLADIVQGVLALPPARPPSRPSDGSAGEDGDVKDPPPR